MVGNLNIMIEEHLSLNDRASPQAFFVQSSGSMGSSASG